ncbi:MAG: twin-arginine translocation signal domain-containing protein [Acetobacter sp.]|jgi:hypothetical protein|nr:twin-arginine translocation signal domain-containing protein [Acetobacter sp.]MCH4061006.1 twin-arginine translocation signal domain-containing protein [Acetobacter sp.]MCH4087946.1 twin-arginine translocation signal domain-containing protein [Acetobacter sp.]MCI1293438.1 twin-arginine translocation signal domain-containing protein [Acetobacter sp.]MCI1319722.1 twin-arginine translocation signal domain-containing protein [Acetobacter sp.]
MQISRRKFLHHSALAATALTAGACTITTSGQVTTLTLNVATIEKYAKAGISAVTTVIGIAAVSSALGPVVVSGIEAAGATLNAALAAFISAAGDTVTISYDDTSWKTQVDSLLDDLDTVVSKLSTALTLLKTRAGSSVVSTASMAVNAVQTVLNAFEALLGTVMLKRGIAGPTQTEIDNALKVLGVA